jgi:prepilin-type N-terminal cleavage/methylation domain-containing protein
MFRRGKKGFTLVELLVILAIMAILATISFASIQYVVGKNAVKAQEAKSKDAIQKVERVCGNLNLCSPQGTKNTSNYIGVNTDIRLDLNQDINPPTAYAGTKTYAFAKFLAHIDIPSDYNMVLQTSTSPPSIGTAPTKDTVYVCVADVSGQTYPYRLTHDIDLQVKGAWYVKSGTTTPVFTYNNSTKVSTEGSVAVS